MTRKLVFISDMARSDTSATSSTASLTNSDSITEASSAFNKSYSITIDNKSSSFQQENIRVKTPSRSPKTVTSFEQLQTLKAGSRAPVDIRNYKNELTKLETKSTIHSKRISDDEIISQLKALSRTTQSEQKTKLFVPAHDPSLQNRKYFSFMTTNKQFNAITQNRRSMESSYMPKVKPLREFDQMNMTNRLSSSSSASSTCSQVGSDSGCGSSIAARSSILSDCNEAAENEMYVTTRMKSLCEKILAKNLSAKNTGLEKPVVNAEKSEEIPKKTQRSKLVTILFDYETISKSYSGVQSFFKVSKGEKVKVLRDYERDFLVATIPDGRVGFVPKDYTVDLKEVEKRFKSNLKQQCARSYQSAYIAVFDDYESLKLTHL